MLRAVSRSAIVFFQQFRCPKLVALYLTGRIILVEPMVWSGASMLFTAGDDGPGGGGPPGGDDGEGGDDDEGDDGMP